MPEIVTEDAVVPARAPGISLFLRNKRPAGLTTYSPARTVLFVHGATYPGHTTFDLKIEGVSWMDHVAARGFDVYVLDLRGYGRSTRPPEMAEPPDLNRPVVRTADAIGDIGAAVDHILAKRGIGSLTLIGWSWGSFSSPSYAIEHPGKVSRLVLYAPIWTGMTGRLAVAENGRLPAYRTITREQARARWYRGVPQNKQASLTAPGVFEHWADVTFASDPDGAKQTPPVIRAPNGVMQDCAEYWWLDKPYYDPAKITVPVLLVTAAWDADVPPAMARALYALLVNSPDKRLVELPQGTHTVMLESNRVDLFEAVQGFLEESEAM
jgi:pimeloyl-ACP methyl ester carboxylesterase